MRTKRLLPALILAAALALVLLLVQRAERAETAPVQVTATVETSPAVNGGDISTAVESAESVGMSSVLLMIATSGKADKLLFAMPGNAFQFR